MACRKQITKILPQLYYPKTRTKPRPTNSQIGHDPLRLIVTKHRYYTLKNTDKKTPLQIKKRTLKKVQTRWYFNYNNQWQHAIENIQLTIEHQKLPLQISFILGRDTSGFNRWRDSPRLTTADPTRFFYNLIRSSFRPLT